MRSASVLISFLQSLLESTTQRESLSFVASTASGVLILRKISSLQGRRATSYLELAKGYGSQTWYVSWCHDETYKLLAIFACFDIATDAMKRSPKIYSRRYLKRCLTQWTEMPCQDGAHTCTSLRRIRSRKGY